MKKLVLAVALASVFGGAQASTISSTASGLFVDNKGLVSNNSKSFSNYNGQPVTYTGNQNQGMWGELWALGGRIVEFTYLGQESGYTNKFFSVGGQLLESSAIGQSVSMFVNSTQKLDFGFYDANTPATFKNGMQQTNPLGFAIMAGNNGFDYFVGFNDGYVSDADYDDFVVGVKVVPLPAAGLLFGSALLGAVGFGRRKQSKLVA